MNYDEEMMPEDYPEPKPPEELEMPEDLEMTSEAEKEPTPAVSLEQFMDLSEAEQAAIWSDLMSMTKETKEDTSQILQLVTRPSDGPSPIAQQLEAILEAITAVMQVTSAMQVQQGNETKANKQFRDEISEKMQALIDLT